MGRAIVIPTVEGMALFVSDSVLSSASWFKKSDPDASYDCLFADGWDVDNLAYISAIASAK